MSGSESARATKATGCLFELKACVHSFLSLRTKQQINRVGSMAQWGKKNDRLDMSLSPTSTTIARARDIPSIRILS